MNKELRDKQLVSLSSSTYGDAIRDYIEEKIEELNSCISIDGTPEEKSIRLEGRQIAIKKLREIFKRLEKNESLEKKRNEYE